MNYGPCDGGPWHGKKVAHPEAVCDVPFEIHSRRISVGVRRGTPGYEHGEYRFEAGTWHWRSAATVSSEPQKR